LPFALRRLDKGEASRLASIATIDQSDRFQRKMCLKRRADVAIETAEIETLANITVRERHTHFTVLPAGLPGLTRLSTVIATAAAAGTSPTLCLRARFIDGERSSAGVAAVESGDCSIRFAVIGHFDKRKSSRPTGVAIGNYRGALDRAIRLKPLAQFSFGRAKGQVPHKNLLHAYSLSIVLLLLGRRRFRIEMRSRAILRCGCIYGVVIQISCVRVGCVGFSLRTSGLAFELPLLFALRFGPLFFLTGLFLLAFRKGLAWPCRQ
jgi:hypothetical protein